MEFNQKVYLLLLSVLNIAYSASQDVIGCGGFVKSEVEINFSLIEIKLYTKQGSLKYSTDCAPNNGYYMIPVYDKGEYVLKVEPPPGWTFDPESVDLHIDGQSDACSKGLDINFQFTGFGIVGKVISKGQSSGPAGVSLTLKKSVTKETVKQVNSVSGGGFTLEKVLPGDYVIEAMHSHWVFETASTTVKVGRETGNAGSAIVVLGYNVQGHVFSDGEPIRGVHFLLFSEDVKAQDVRGCDRGDVRGFPSGSQAPLCYATSREDGVFSFEALPCGAYTLVPFYKGDQITFDVVPSQIQFQVHHDSLILTESFQVAGFSVSGQVLMSVGGSGVANAEVLLNGKEQVLSRADGSYHLDSMKAGTYRLLARTHDLSFDEVTVKVNPNTPQLPDLVASRFSACGRVVIEQLPEGLQLPASRQISIEAKGQGSKVTVETSAEGSFCAMLKPGTYLVKVHLSDAEVKAGLKLAPAEREVVIHAQPVKGLRFSQFRARVSGTIHCLESCQGQQLSLSAVGRTDDRMVTQAHSTDNKATFTFENVIPGRYRVSLLTEDWCWKEKTLEFQVTDENKGGLQFTQSGYILSCSLSHDITLNFAQEGKTENVGSFNLTKGVNKFCLAQPGVYKLTPVSCHRFEQEIYRHDTSHPIVLTLTAVQHRIDGIIVTKERSQDILVSIKSSQNAETVTLGPLKHKADVVMETSKDKTEKKGKKDAEVKVEKGPFRYSFTHWARGGEKLEISASSKQQLFYPSATEVTVNGDRCLTELVQFEGRLGVFVSGSIQPALGGVHITITADNNPAVKIDVNTDDKGTYRVGPLHSDTTYSVSAKKEGYVLSVAPGSTGSFKAHKLGQISVQVVDEVDTPLSGVLLSLSGGSAYRSNNLTQDNGLLDFTSLSPGQYFLRPMMKEYHFEPVSQMIDVLEGSTGKIKIKGKRTAYSCFGAVTSLNGAPEPGVFVEAVGRSSEACNQLQEESKTEQDGSFRIRGLQPQCQYEVRLKSEDVNHHIERSAPKSYTVKVADSDVKDLHIIAFRRMTQLDLSGNIITQSEFLPSLKVQLYRESDMDSPVHTTSLGSTPFFYLPSLKIDNQNYILRQESSLSRSMYDYELSEVTFLANVTYHHFTLTFDPKRRSVDQELSQGSLLILPLALLAVLASYHYQKILPFLSQSVENLQRSLSTSKGGSVRASTPVSTHDSGAPLEISPELLVDPSISRKKAKLRKT